MDHLGIFPRHLWTMGVLNSILVPLQIAFVGVWIFVICLTHARFQKFRKHGFLTLSHILRASLWGEVAILAEMVRRILSGMSIEGIFPVWVGEAVRSPLGMLPVFLLMVATALDCLYLFRRRRFEGLAEEHEARLQIGRLAARLHAASESLEQRNRDLEKANWALATAEKKFRDFFEHAPLHYHTLDRQGIILDSNELELQDLGYNRDELIGQHISKIMHPSTMEQNQATFRRFWETGLHAGTEAVLCTKEGRPIPIRLYSTAVRDEHGSIIAARTIWIDISAQKRAEAEVTRQTGELNKKNYELEARNRELQEVGHVISHDLKAPLRGVEAFLGFLDEDCGPNLGSTGRSHIATIQESCRRLRRMIDDLIEYARFGHTGKFELLSLPDVVEEVVDGLRLNLQARRAEIQMAPDLPQVFGDRVQLTTILRNLIDNALKYGPANNPHIEIGTLPRSMPGQATFFVKDNGIGIQKEHQTKIFGLFQRLHGPGQYEGTGMGLALVKKAIDSHGGKIWVESQPGKGSTFFLTLPAPLKVVATPPKRHPRSQPGDSDYKQASG